jgi:hypothetical protein
MKSKFNFAAVCGALMVFALVSARPGYAAPPANVCTLLTPAQINAELGVPAAGKSLGPNLCIWVQTGVKPGSARRKVDLVMLIMQGYDLAKTPNSQTSVIPVSGLGDDAYYFAMASGQAMELRVKKGGVAFGIRVQRSGTSFTIDQIKAKEKTLALEVLAKL